MHKSFGSRTPSHDGTSGHTLHNAGHNRCASSRTIATVLLHTSLSINNWSKHIGSSGTPSHSPASVVVVAVTVVTVVVVVVAVVVVVVVTVEVVVTVVVMQESQSTGQVAIKNVAISGVLKAGSQKFALLE